jgi:DNA repair photolyase
MDSLTRRTKRGRGALSNPDGRYQVYTREDFDDGWSAAESAPSVLPTTVSMDAARSILTRNDSPDVPFEQSINPYRGCEHGCIYCFARPSHAYLGLSPGLDFETRLFAKPNAAVLLARELSAPGYRCSPIALGTNTDPYQPIERNLRITRQILELLASCRHPVSIVTKGSLIERDIPLLADMSGQRLVHVMVSVTTLDRGLARRMEPRAAAPQRRLEIVRALCEAGIPTGVLFAPVIPGLNEAEMETVLEACRSAGAIAAGYVLLRLPWEVKDLFREWLEEHWPLKARHVMSLVRATRGGRDYDASFGERMRGTGPYAELIGERFRLACKRLGLDRTFPPLEATRFRPPSRPVCSNGVCSNWVEQLALFERDEQGPEG